jgi:hypothetical protein
VHGLRPWRERPGGRQEGRAPTRGAGHSLTTEQGQQPVLDKEQLPGTAVRAEQESD